MTSESAVAVIEDLHLVLSPSTSRFDKSDEDFLNNVNDGTFNADDPFANILTMHKRVRMRQEKTKNAWKNEHKDIINNRKNKAA